MNIIDPCALRKRQELLLDDYLKRLSEYLTKYLGTERYNAGMILRMFISFTFDKDNCNYIEQAWLDNPENFYQYLKGLGWTPGNHIVKINEKKSYCVGNIKTRRKT